jgi:hypothetical protein
MFLFPSLKTPTWVPLIAALDALATSALGDAHGVRAVRVDLNLQLKIVLKPVIPKNGNARGLGGGEFTYCYSLPFVAVIGAFAVKGHIFCKGIPPVKSGKRQRVSLRRYLRASYRQGHWHDSRA